MLANLVLYILMNGIVVFIQKIPALGFFQCPHILHKQLESHAVRGSLSSLFGDRPICTRTATQQKIIPLKLCKIAVKYVPVMDGAVLYNTLERKQRTMVAIPVNTVNGKSHTIPATYYKAGTNLFPSFHAENSRQKIAVPVGAAQRGRYNGGDKTVQHVEVRNDGKSNCLTTVQKDTLVCAPVRVGYYGKGGQGQRIYSVRGKLVTLSANGGGQGAKTGLYKIDLPDGDYIIRKLTPVEAERLQTLPDNYTAGISNTQRYKCIGNGWTVDVIAHILSHI